MSSAITEQAIDSSKGLTLTEMIEHREVLEQQIRDFRKPPVRVRSDKPSGALFESAETDAHGRHLEQELMEAAEALMAHRSVQALEVFWPGDSRALVVATKEALPEMLAKVSRRVRRPR